MKPKITLGESYYNRHKINVPIVKHISSGFLFFRTEIAPFHEIVFIKYNADSESRGCYNFSKETVDPFSDSYDGYLNTVPKQTEDITWEQYESYVINIKNNLKLNNSAIVFESLDISLFAWEVFLFSNQHNLTKDFCFNDPLMLNSINFRNPIEDRYLALDQFVNKNQHAGLIQDWYSFHNDYVFSYYSYEMAKLISNET